MEKETNVKNKINLIFYQISRPIIHGIIYVNDLIRYLFKQSNINYIKKFLIPDAPRMSTFVESELFPKIVYEN